jgi:AcrR family transcriptional regulator
VPRPKQRTPELRRRVVQAGLGVLHDEGIAGFTTRKVAEAAGTSVPAVYELFGARSGLVREVYFEGFRLLRRRFDELGESVDPRADLVSLIDVIRAFAVRHPALVDVMFSRPFTDFDPGPDEAEAGAAVRTFIVGRVRRCVDAGVLHGDRTDISHALLALAQGLAAQEAAGWLGTSKASVNRRWRLAVDALLDGLAGSRHIGP